MLIIMKKILFVCGIPPHPVHGKFAKSIGADFFNYNDKSFGKKLKNLWKIPKGYDIYLSEGLFNYVVLSKMVGHLDKKAQIINLFADPRIYQIIDGRRFNFNKEKVEKYPFLKKIFVKKLIKKLDKGICVGKFEENILNKLSKIPTENIPAFIERKEFFKGTSKLKENNILFIAGGPDYYYKGLDFLLKVFSKIQKEFPNSKLFVIGGGWEKFRKNVKTKNVFFEGKKDLKGIKKLMDKCSLCCHFGRGDTFPVSTLEAMASGMPCFVSNSTGTKEVVNKISKDFIFKMDEGKVAKDIIKYMKKNTKEKKKIGQKFKKIASFYNEKNCINLFKENFSRLIKENESIDDKSPNKNCR